MRTLSAAEITHLQARAGVRPRVLVWITARNLLTDVMESMGLWNGDDTITLVVGAETRTYQGAGALLGMDDPIYEVGLQVRRINIWLALAAPEVLQAARGYDLRMAPVEVHRVLTDPVTHLPIAPPHRVWKGYADGAPETRPGLGAGGGRRLTLTVASAAMALTRTLTAKYSDESMKRRGGDRLFRYADVSGKVPVFWGEVRYEPPAPPPPPGPPPKDHGK